MPPNMRHDARLADVGAGRIAEMDEAGVTVQVLSSVGPGSDLLSGTEAVRFAHDTNDRLAEAVRARPHRLAGFAHLPMSVPAAAPHELERCIKTLGYRGAMIHGMTGGRFLDHPDYAPLLTAAEQLDVPLYLHPGLPPEAVRHAYFDVVAVEALRNLCRSLDVPLSGAGCVLDLLQDWSRNLLSIRAALTRGVDERLFVPLKWLRQHAPVLYSHQVVCMGANYRKHVIELLVAQGGGAATGGTTGEQRRRDAETMMDDRAAHGRPYAWVKTQTSIAGPDDDLALPAVTEQPDWELELAVVMGRAARHVSPADALDHVAGYMIANDATARDFIYRADMKAIGTDWLAGKGAPGFLPTGPYIVPRDEIADPHALRITLSINGQVMQDESTADMIFDIPRQIEYISAHMQLLAGDVICTGLPAGNGTHHNRYLRPGDLMQGEITGLGRQSVRCVK